MSGNPSLPSIEEVIERRSNSLLKLRYPTEERMREERAHQINLTSSMRRGRSHKTQDNFFKDFSRSRKKLVRAVLERFTWPSI
jgi:hypothetical protein